MRKLFGSRIGGAADRFALILMGKSSDEDAGDDAEDEDEDDGAPCCEEIKIGGDDSRADDAAASGGGWRWVAVKSVNTSLSTELIDGISKCCEKLVLILSNIAPL